MVRGRGVGKASERRREKNDSGEARQIAGRRGMEAAGEQFEARPHEKTKGNYGESTNGGQTTQEKQPRQDPNRECQISITDRYFAKIAKAFVASLLKNSKRAEPGFEGHLPAITKPPGLALRAGSGRPDRELWRSGP